MSTVPPFSLDEKRFDQSTYYGRVRHFLQVIDPTTLFVSTQTLNQSLQLLEKHRQRAQQGLGKDPAVSDAQLWEAQKLKDAIIHPQTNENINPFVRWSAFVPMNVPIVVGMISTTSPMGTVFWQWVNQTYNVAVNYANRNASKEMSYQQIGIAYAGAVAASCGLALGLGHVAKNAVRLPRFVGALVRVSVPYISVASAGAANVLLMRKNEMDEGIDVEDEQGRVVGTSQVAGQKAIVQSALTRVVLPAPTLLLPPIIMGAFQATILKRLPIMRTPLSIATVTACLWGALPLSIGVFPQRMSVPVSELEPKFAQITDSTGRPYSTLYYNRGL